MFSNDYEDLLLEPVHFSCYSLLFSNDTLVSVSGLVSALAVVRARGLSNPGSCIAMEEI